MARHSIVNIAAALAASLCGAAMASPVPSALTISAQVSFDTVNSVGPTGGATQTGTLSLISGGVAAVPSTFTDDPTTVSPDTLAGSLTATGDGVGVQTSMSGRARSTESDGVLPATTDGLFADYNFDLNNSSATSTFVVTFRVAATNAVSATGEDAFAFSQLSVLDNTFFELYFTDFQVDTLNPGNNFELSSSGDSFAITLNPGANVAFTALHSQRGGAYAPGDYSASLDGFIYVDSIEERGGNNNVPLPGTAPLLALGLAAIAASRRRLS